MIRLPDGSRLDVPPAVRCFQMFDHNTRANLMASRRLGHRQREAVGRFFWVHPLAPDIAFETKGAAERAAVKALAGAQ